MLGRSGVFNAFSVYSIFNLQWAHGEVTPSQVKEELYTLNSRNSSVRETANRKVKLNHQVVHGHAIPKSQTQEVTQMSINSRTDKLCYIHIVIYCYKQQMDVSHTVERDELNQEYRVCLHLRKVQKWSKSVYGITS